VAQENQLRFEIAVLDPRVTEGDRVEIYRNITADPEAVERRDIGKD
jgi:putative ubiquitin-RnfH superfamily antitoxin RatB of RatAB toxin-antitoxin module